MQRLCLLHLGQRPHFRKHVLGKLSVDLDERNGAAARRFAADVEGRDVDAGLA